MAAKPVLAVFDFDDTLITTDSLIDFFRTSFPLPVFMWKFLLLAPTVARFKAGLIPNYAAKERLLRLFLKGMPVARFSALCEAYIPRLDSLINPEAMDRVTWHRQQGHETIIISASIEDWIKPWAAKHEFGEVLASKAGRKDGVLTGSLDGPNCYGPEKVNRLLAAYPERGTYTLYMYGDGKSDQDILRIADHAFEATFE